MKRTWLVVNPTSGSVDESTIARVEAALEEHATLVGRTDFPEVPLPDQAELNERRIDTLVLLAGDGTINAAACAYSSWHGALLILPGGTMNLLPKLLHGVADPATIIASAAEARAIDLPYASADGRCGYVGLILGPAASWGRARERLRAGKLRGMWRAVRHAWSGTMARRVRLEGVPGRSQAVFVRAESDVLIVSTVEARDWRAIAELGWDWVTGDWVAASAVDSYRRARFAIGGRRPVHALFDGELHLLAPGTEIAVERSRPMFLSTLKADE